ncbi:FtsK/SpoIIIE domain-containing protein [Streptomyces sp. NPDC087270]|uniref:FtsK/SpoIIIE domain-containing protein n=1 Tax=Streptomyces sp. NPDC087270 TaxID=3365774 RepID=UPI00380A71D8
MQIRLTVLGPRGSGRAARGCDVLVTAPAGTALSTVAGALASAAGSAQPGGRSSGSSVVLYAGTGRLAPTAVLGVPPLVDGALISLHAPAEQQGDHGQYGRFGQYGRPPADLATLHVVGGPDAGGVHLLQGGQAGVGRSADADVPLDDPDVSRLHCEIAVGADGTVTVADLGSTNGTTLSGRPVGTHPLPFPPGELLRIGESTLRLTRARPAAPPPLSTAVDSEGHLRVAPRGGDGGPESGAEPGTRGSARAGRPTAGPGPYEEVRGDGPHGAPTGAGRGAPDGDAVPGGADGDGHGGYGGFAGDGGAGGHSDHSGHSAHDRGPETLGGAAWPPAEPPAVDSSRRATGERNRRDLDEPPRAGVVGVIGAWARRLAGGRQAPDDAGPETAADDPAAAEALRERWPDPAAVLLTALGPGRRLWERAPTHPDALTVRLGTADLPAPDGTGLLRGAPYTVDLRAPATSALTLAGPRPRLAGLARAVLAQLCALHSPAVLEVVLVSADRTRGADERTEEWSWLNWLPHLRPAHGQDCRLLLAFDRDQAEARTSELVRRLESGPLGPGWATAPESAVTAAAARHDGPYTLLVLDGDPGSAALRDALTRISTAGPSAGIHVLCLAETGERPAVQGGVVAHVSGDVATTLRLEAAPGTYGAGAGAGTYPAAPVDGTIVLDAVSAVWAEHFARALAPLREADAGSVDVPSRHVLPATVRLLDELDLAIATPARIAARWGEAPGTAGGAAAVIGVGAGGRVAVDLVAEGPHAIVGGAPGAGKTELLRSLVAALAAADRPERLALVLVDGAGAERGEGLASCADLPHVSTHLVATDPVRMREFAQALSAELKRRAEVLGGEDFAAWHSRGAMTGMVPHQGGRRGGQGSADSATGAGGSAAGSAGAASSAGAAGSARSPGSAGSAGSASVGSGPGAAARPVPVLPRLVVVVDDFDALVAPGLGSPGRPSAGSVVRALEAVARDGERLGVHLFAATGRPERTAGTDTDERARLRIALRTADPESAALLVHVEDPAGLDDAVPGRGYLRRPGGAVTPFQAARVSARIPRTATLRPTVVPLEWERMGDPPARRQVRELGNGPTDLALLASALQRAAETPPEEPAPRGARQAAAATAPAALIQPRI